MRAAGWSDGRFGALACGAFPSTLRATVGVLVFSGATRPAGPSGRVCAFRCGALPGRVMAVVPSNDFADFIRWGVQ